MRPNYIIILISCLVAIGLPLGFGRPMIELSEESLYSTQPIDKLSPDDLTALQAYVQKEDNNYQWVYHPEFDAQGSGYKVLWLNVTSQRWLTDADVSRSIWYHWVAVIVPNNLNPDFNGNALLWIGGGKNDATPPGIWDKELIVCAALAQEIGAIVASVYTIPNQPMVYYEEPSGRGRSEDAMIAWAWAHYIRDPSNPEWLPRLPMTKASIRAMDAVTEFWSIKSGPTLAKWVVAGASKRGWTTWTVGACDPKRVIGIIPMVLDELDFVSNIKHHFRAYGGWSFALDDYYKVNFTANLDHPNVAKMMSIVDPINYVDILTMPKLILSTAGDEFLLPDNNDWYWSKLQGEKHFHSFPNLEHTMFEDIPNVIETARGFVLHLLSNTPRPSYVWNKTDNGTIVLEIDANNPPSKVQLYTAYTIDGNDRRDFRLVAIMNKTTGAPFLHPVFWKPTDLAPTSTTPSLITYEAYVDPPTTGWVGFVIVCQFPVPGSTNATFRMSTAQSILPQTYPFPECYGEDCYGTLV